jgi:hypothetical protein
MTKALLDVCNKVLSDLKPPAQWLDNIIVPIPKKGSRMRMQNYRGISLLSVAAKTYNRMLLDRIYDQVNCKLRPNQAGFRRGMSCLEQIHTLRRIIEGTRDKQIPLITTFVDFSKAFDSISREKMWKILRAYGIPDRIVRAIKCLYDNSSSKVLVNNEYSKPFQVTTGVLQGDTLAPFLFVIVLDYALQRIPQHFGLVTHEEPRTTIPDLDFADDIALLDGDYDSARDHLIALKQHASNVGLQLNTDKTKFMAFPAEVQELKLPDGTIIQQVEEFKYLGSMMSSSVTDFKCRRGQAWSTFWNMKHIWRSKALPLKLKLDIFQSTCLSILLYGSEAWVITRDMMAKLNSYATSCYRYTLGIKKTDRIRNEVILEKVQKPPLIDTVRERQLRRLGHVLRQDPSLICQRYALYWPQHGKSKRGRPKLVFHKYVEQITGRKR